MAIPSEWAGPPVEWAGLPVSPTLPYLRVSKVCLMQPGLVHCQISVHVQTSDVVVMAPRNRKQALMLAVAGLAAPTLFI